MLRMFQNNNYNFNVSNIHFFMLQYVSYTCGLIRGALANLGITCIVTAEVHLMPACRFHIQVQKS